MNDNYTTNRTTIVGIIHDNCTATWTSITTNIIHDNYTTKMTSITNKISDNYTITRK